MKNTDNLTECGKAMSEWLELSMQISFRSHFMFFKQQGFSHSQVAALHMLHHKKNCAVNDVSRMLSVSKPAASQLLDHLVKRGFVERHEDLEDRRIKHHKLTPSGLRLMKESLSARKDWYQSLIDGLAADELDKIKEALDILNRKIRVFESNSDLFNGELSKELNKC